MPVYLISLKLFSGDNEIKQNDLFNVILGPQGFLGASRRRSDDDVENFFKKDVKKMEEKDDELQTDFGATSWPALHWLVWHP